MAERLKAAKGMSDFVGHAAGVITRRLQANPKQYLEFGMYWPSLKKLLNEHGADLGDDLIDDEMATTYSYKSPAALIYAAEWFKDVYRETWFVGNNQFTITDDGLNWTLHDEDMEAKG